MKKNKNLVRTASQIEKDKIDKIEKIERDKIERNKRALKRTNSQNERDKIQPEIREVKNNQPTNTIIKTRKKKETPKKDIQEEHNIGVTHIQTSPELKKQLEHNELPKKFEDDEFVFEGFELTPELQQKFELTPELQQKNEALVITGTEIKDQIKEETYTHIQTTEQKEHEEKQNNLEKTINLSSSDEKSIAYDNLKLDTLIHEQNELPKPNPEIFEKEEPKKEELKKVELKKVEPKKVELKKVEPKKVELKKVEPKKVELKKVEPKKEELKKVEPKKEELKKDPKKEEPKQTLLAWAYSGIRSGIGSIPKTIQKSLGNAVNDVLAPSKSKNKNK